jgi:hypothetical protein
MGAAVTVRGTKGRDMGASDQRPPITGGEHEPSGRREQATAELPVPGTSVLPDGDRSGREATYADFLGEQVED